MKKDLPPGVHLILGDSAGGSFIQAFHARDRLFIDQDVLSCGPTRPCADLAAWRAMRLEFWNGLFEDDDEPYEGSAHSVLRNLGRLREAGRINLWFATSLSEQLSVAFTLDVLDMLQVDPARVYLVPFAEQRDRPDPVRAMGQLNPEQMAEHPVPVPLTSEVREDYRAAWAAMTSDDPHGFERFANARQDASLWLKRAMMLMLRRFPDRQSGLVHWDRVILGEVRGVPLKCARVIGEVIGTRWDDGDFVGDSWLFARLLHMADKRLPQPLLKLTGPGPGMREYEVALTPFGLDVLEGRASSYPTNPIEDWAAGVKLSSSAGALWFRDGDRLIKA